MRNFCRLCGNKQAVVSKYPVSKFNLGNDVKKALDIDFSFDISYIHPPFICDCCRLKFSRWRKKKKLKLKASININVFEFKEHDNTSCLICEDLVDSAVIDSDFLDCCKDFGYAVTENQNDFLIFKIAVSTEKFSERIYINKKDRNWQIFIHDLDKSKSKHFENIPGKYSLKGLLKLLTELRICEGNRGFDELCRGRSETNPAVFLAQDGQTVSAYEEVSFNHVKTVRHSNC